MADNERFEINKKNTKISVIVANFLVQNELLKHQIDILGFPFLFLKLFSIEIPIKSGRSFQEVVKF